MSAGSGPAGPLRPADIGELVALAALWGGSFLFMRIAAPTFGPIALIAVRVAGAALLLMPLLLWRGQGAELRHHWRAIGAVGLTNSALPFLGFAYAALSISAGLAAIFNAAAPLFGALIGWLWLRQRLGAARVAGLLIGFGGVLWLAWHAAGFRAGGSGWATLACLAATVLYGWSANLTQRYLGGVAPLAVAAGSQLSATLALALPAWFAWPSTPPSSGAWLTAAALAVLCTGLAYVMYFRLIARIGPANAISVTFLVPAFAALWGWLLLDERLGPTTLAACAVILAGTALATGLIGSPLARTAPARSTQA